MHSYTFPKCKILIFKKILIRSEPWILTYIIPEHILFLQSMRCPSKLNLTAESNFQLLYSVLPLLCFLNAGIVCFRSSFVFWEHGNVPVICGVSLPRICWFSTVCVASPCTVLGDVEQSCTDIWVDSEARVFLAIKARVFLAIRI